MDRLAELLKRCLQCCQEFTYIPPARRTAQLQGISTRAARAQPGQLRDLANAKLYHELQLPRQLIAMDPQRLGTPTAAYRSALPCCSFYTKSMSWKSFYARRT